MKTGKRLLGIIIWIAALIILGLCAWIIISGFRIRTDVSVLDYSVMERENTISIRVGVTGSAGHVRAYRAVYDEEDNLEISFYSAFGGTNGSIGAKDYFMIWPDENCTRIFITAEEQRKLLFYKDPDTGKWSDKGTGVREDQNSL